MSRDVLVSVVVPAFDCERFLARALESVESPPGVAVEIVVVDDGSRDGTAALAREIAARDPRVTVLTQANSGGPAAPRNRAIAASHGEFVAFLDPDDYWYPGKLAQQLALMQSDPGIDLVFCDADLIDGHGARLGKRYLERNDYFATARAHFEMVGPDAWVSRPSYFEFTAVGPVGPLTSGVLVRRTALEREPVAFPVDLPTGEDSDLWYRLIGGGRTGYVDRPLFAYRIHPAGLMQDRLRVRAGQTRAHERNYARVAARLSTAGLATYRRRIAELHFDHGYELWRAGRRADALRAYRRSFEWRPAPRTIAAMVKALLRRS